MTKDYTQFGIENYLLKITGVFKYDKEFCKKAIASGYFIPNWLCNRELVLFYGQRPV
jgi:hypothetical protein